MQELKKRRMLFGLTTLSSESHNQSKGTLFPLLPNLALVVIRNSFIHYMYQGHFLASNNEMNF